MTIKTLIRFAVPGVLMLACQSAWAEDSSISFTFAPPPITSPGQHVNKMAFNAVSMEYDSVDPVSGDETTSEFSLVGLNFLTKNNGVFLSGAMVAGSDDADINSLTGMNFTAGYEGVSDGGFGMSGSLGMNLLYLETDMTSGTPYFYSETTMTTMQLNLAVQQRIALGDHAGITPYVTVAYMLGGTGSSDTTIIAVGYADQSTTTFDIDPYMSTQIGFDIDVAGFSLAAFFQESDNSSVTSVNLGFEF